ncbi:hypothetical protein K6025_02870 [Ehrlichia sp. JZT12]
MSKVRASIIFAVLCVIFTILIAGVACVKKLYNTSPIIFIVTSVISFFILSVVGLGLFMYCKSTEINLQSEDRSKNEGDKGSTVEIFSDSATLTVKCEHKDKCCENPIVNSSNEKVMLSI